MESDDDSAPGHEPESDQLHPAPAELSSEQQGASSAASREADTLKLDQMSAETLLQDQLDAEMKREDVEQAGQEGEDNRYTTAGAGTPQAEGQSGSTGFSDSSGKHAMHQGGSEHSRPRSASHKPGVTHWYKKTPGSADMSGELYEVKLAALFYLRAINSKQPFHLATNMAAAGAFDDIVLRRFVDGKWSTSFIQLKHKTNRDAKVGFAPLLSMGSGSDFGLVKYGVSYKKVKEEFEKEIDLQWCGNFEDFHFILYTNASADKALEGNQPTGENNPLFSTNPKGKTFNFSIGPCVFTGIRESVKFKALLINLLRERDEADERNITNIIKDQVNAYEVSSFNKELAAKKSSLIVNPERSTINTILRDMSLVGDLTLYEEFLGNMYLCTGQGKEQSIDNLIIEEMTRAFINIDVADAKTLSTELTSMVCKWWRDKNTKGLWLTQDSTVWRSIVTLRIAQLSGMKLKEFAKVPIKFVESSVEQLSHIQRTTMLNVIVEEGTSTMIGSRIFAILEQEHCIFIGLLELFGRREEVFSVWKNELCDGLVIDCDEQLAGDTVKELASEMEKNITELKNLRCILVSTKDDSLSKILNTTYVKFTKIEDKCAWSDLTTESQTSLLALQVTFQGHAMKLSKLIQDSQQLTRIVQGSMLAQLVEEERKIGQDLETLIGYYIPRKLSHKNKSINIKSLTDVDERTILVIAEPGMGKTTLLTHLAQAAKSADPTTWVVRINLIDCTAYLATLRSDQIDRTKAIEFITKFAAVTGSHLQESLFSDQLLTTGKIVALFDGADEVCPVHEESICCILKHLQKTKISKILVASRITAKKSLERTLGVESSYLEAFTLNDQMDFLIACWKTKFKHKSALKKFVGKVINHVSATFLDTSLIGIPLQTRMLADYFEEHVDVYLQTGILQVPERINLLKLYERFVEKKIQIHFAEKKKDDLDNAAVNVDNENLEKLILGNHMNAALEVLLSPEELLTIKSPNEMYIIFREQIEKGHEKLGIIIGIVDSRPHFIHKTFIEYFAAIWISQNYEICRSFLQKSLFEPEFHVVNSFLKLQLSTDFDLHNAVVNSDLSTVKRLLSSGDIVNQKDGGGRTALHLATAIAAKQQLLIVQTLLAHGAKVDDLDDLLHWTPLRYADKVGAWAVAGLLLQLGGLEADMNDAKSNINTDVFTNFIVYLSDPHSSTVELMHAASRHGEQEVLKFLVEECLADVSCRGVGGVTPMHVSAECGQVDVMRFLLEHGASVHVTDNCKNRPLHYAARRGQTETIKLLLDPGATVNSSYVVSWIPSILGDALSVRNTFGSLVARNTEGCTPLLLTMEQGHEEAAMLLIANGADVNARSKEGWTPLLYSEHHGIKRLTDYLIQKGATKQSNELSQWTKTHKFAYLICFLVAIACAAFLGNLFHSENGVSVNCSNTEDTELLHWAVMMNQPDCVKELLKAGADINAKDKQGMTPMFYVCYMNSDEKPTAEAELEAIVMLDLLLRSGADITVKSNKGQSVKCFAKEINNCKIMRFIEQIEGDGNETTVLQIAVKRGEINLVRHLVEHNDDISVTDKHGNTIQHLACIGGSLDVLKYLIEEHNADIRVTDKDRNTLQHIACRVDSLDILKYLIEKHNVDLTVANIVGDTPINSVFEGDSVEVLDYLLREFKFPFKNSNMVGTSLQHVACKSNAMKVLKYLILIRKVDLKATNYGGLTLQHFACIGGSLDVLKYLVEVHNTDLTVTDYSGSTLLHYAAWKGKIHVAKYLVEKGANPKAVNYVWKQPLHWVDATTPDRDKMERFLFPLS